MDELRERLAGGRLQEIQQEIDRIRWGLVGLHGRLDGVFIQQAPHEELMHLSREFLREQYRFIVETEYFIREDAWVRNAIIAIHEYFFAREIFWGRYNPVVEHSITCVIRVNTRGGGG